MGYSQSGYINDYLFSKWIDECFLPHIAFQRFRYRYNGPAVLFLDGATSHKIDKLEEKFARYNIKIFLFPPHSSHVLQPLDLVLFHAHKSAIRRYKPGFICEVKFVNRIVKLLSSWQAAATTSNINGAWEAMGFSYTPHPNGTTTMTISMEDNKRVMQLLTLAQSFGQAIDASRTGKSMRYSDLLDELTHRRITLEQFNGLSGQMTDAQYEEIRQQFGAPFGQEEEQQQEEQQEEEQQQEEGNVQLMQGVQYFGQIQQPQYYGQIQQPQYYGQIQQPQYFGQPQPPNFIPFQRR